MSSEDVQQVIEKIQRVYNLVANLAHPKDDHCENPLEDEAHDLLRELRRHVQQAADLLAQQAQEIKRWRAVGEHYERAWEREVQPQIKAAKARADALAARVKELEEELARVDG